jgi:hypothetical protein
MARTVELRLFDQVDDYADSIRRGELERDDEFDPNWDILTFCQLFFDQFFGEFGINISGFSQRSRETVAELIEELNAAGKGSQQAKDLIVLYEQFCDMNDDCHGAYGGSTPLDVLTFHQEYLLELLEASLEWAKSENRKDLQQRVAGAIQGLNSAIERTQWLTRLKTRKFGLWKLISRKRTTS